MSVRFLRARVRPLPDFPELESCTFVWDEADEDTEAAVRELIRDGAAVEDFEMAAAARFASALPQGSLH